MNSYMLKNTQKSLKLQDTDNFYCISRTHVVNYICTHSNKTYAFKQNIRIQTKHTHSNKTYAYKQNIRIQTKHTHSNKTYVLNMACWIVCISDIRIFYH